VPVARACRLRTVYDTAGRLTHTTAARAAAGPGAPGSPPGATIGAGRSAPPTLRVQHSGRTAKTAGCPGRRRGRLASVGSIALPRELWRSSSVVDR